MKKILVLVLLPVLGVIAGCITPEKTDKPGAGILTESQLTEPAWIRNGEPIVFEGEDWFPTDNIENLLDSEVYRAGVYREVPFFQAKIHGELGLH